MIDVSNNTADFGEASINPSQLNTEIKMFKRSVYFTLLLLFSSMQILHAEEIFLLENVKYFDVHSRSYVQVESILIQDGVINYIGPKPEKMEFGFRRIDVQGKYLFPGFIDSHAHVTIMKLSNPPIVVRMDQLDREATLETLARCLDFGITTVRNPGSPTPYGIPLREQIERGEIEGPRIRTAGNVIQYSKSPRQNDASRLFVYVHDAASLIEEIDRQVEADVDCIKLYNQMPPELVRAAVEYGKKRNIPITAHLDKTSWVEGAQSKLQSLCHFCSWHPDELEPHVREEYKRRSKKVDGMLKRLDWLELLDVEGPIVSNMLSSLKENNTIVDATLVAYETKFKGDDPFYSESTDIRFAPAALRQQWSQFTFTKNWTAKDYARGHALWPKVLLLARHMFDNGVILAVGSDTPNPWVVPGVGWHRELAIMAEAEIPLTEIMRMATWNGALLIGMEDRIGSIEIGKDADLVLLAADPLIDISNSRKIDFVIQRGRIVRERLTEAAGSIN